MGEIDNERERQRERESQFRVNDENNELQSDFLFTLLPSFWNLVMNATEFPSFLNC